MQKAEEHSRTCTSGASDDFWVGERRGEKNKKETHTHSPGRGRREGGGEKKKKKKKIPIRDTLVSRIRYWLFVWVIPVVASRRRCISEAAS
jgi:hypothetical protein